MDLTFNKVGNVYIAEFKAEATFSLHIEKPEGSVAIKQTSVEGSDYDEVRNQVSYTDKDRVIDTEVRAAMWPKWIKIVSTSLPTMAVVTFAQ